MQLYICNESKSERKKLEEIVQNVLPINEINTVKCFTCPDEMLRHFKANSSERPNIILMDVEYQNGNDGISCASIIKKAYKNILIIFVSEHTDRVFESFRCEPFSFIPKPYTITDLTEVTGRAIDKINQENAHINVRWNGHDNSIRIDTIKYVEYMNKRLIFYTFEGVYKTIGTLSNLFEKLKEYGFVQTHQSFIVNMNMIKNFTRNEVVLIDNSTVMLSLRKRAKVLRAYSKFLLGIRKDDEK